MHEKKKADPSGNVYEVEGVGGGEGRREREADRDYFLNVFLGGRGHVQQDLRLL